MKTIKIILLLAFFGMAAQSQAQTKEETVKWLTEKMMKPCFLADMNDYRYRAKIIYVKFDDNFLYYTKETTWSESGETTRSYLMKVDLTKVKPIKEDGILETDGKYVEALNEKGEVQHVSNSAFWINESDCENDLIPRFQKALNHYISLMTVKPVVKEAF